MGSQSSKQIDPQVHRALVARVRALELESQSHQRETRLPSASNTSTSHHESHHLREDDYQSSDNEIAPPLYREPVRSLETDQCAAWQESLLADPKNRLALAAFTQNAAKTIVSSRQAIIADQQHFNIRIPLEGSPVTNQRSSGRCWLFASTNVFRVAVMKKYKLKAFQFSQAYLFFWDKIEKANYFLETILDTLDEPLDGRLLQSLLAAPINDGGQWDMVANLVSKYGLVPQELYPDSYNAMNSRDMDVLITTKLRENAIRLRQSAQDKKEKSNLAAMKGAMIRDIYGVLVLMLGPPPRPEKLFKWQYESEKGELKDVEVTPLEFASQLSDSSTCRAMGGTDVHKLFSLVHDPRNEYETLLTVDRLGNVLEGRPITYVNVKMSQLKEACIKTLKKGVPVFFGSDVGKYSDSARGIMDTALYDYELGFNIKLGMSKAERLMTGESAMTHAMVLTGVQVEDGKDVRWRVENSWSEAVGDKGYFIMTSAWFDEFVYQAVVDPSVVNSNILDVLEQDPKVLPNWDPMGALA